MWRMQKRWVKTGGGEKRNEGTRKGGACEEDGAKEAPDQLRAKKIKTVAHSKAKLE